jgi:hypothetical protein
VISRVLEVAAWLAAASLATAGLYWGFVNTPESRVLTLVLSGVLVLAMVLVAAIAGNAAVLLALGESRRTSLMTGVRRAHWFIVAALAVVLVVWAIRRGDGWIARYSGEISAWFIATFNWADITPLFRAEMYVSRWLRWVVIPAAALAAVAGVLQNGIRAIASLAWIKAAWRWQTLAAATGAYLLLIELPWRLAFWKPSPLPPTWVEPALAGLRLLVVGIAMMLGAAIIVVTTAQAAAAAYRK